VQAQSNAQTTTPVADIPPPAQPVVGYPQEHVPSVMSNPGGSAVNATSFDPGNTTISTQDHDNPRPAPQQIESQPGPATSSSPQDIPSLIKNQAASQKITPQARTAANLAQSLTLPPNYKPTTILPPPKAYSVSRSSDSQSKLVYPQQQNFQPMEIQNQAPQHEQSTSQQQFEPADVPPNSSAIIEQMMINLRKARAGN
jgi:hypothetical protein